MDNAMTLKNVTCVWLILMIPFEVCVRMLLFSVICTSVDTEMWMSIFHIINLKKKPKPWTQGPGFFLIKK